MDRQEVKSIGEAVMRILDAHKNDEPLLRDYDIARSGGNFGSGHFGMKLSITPKMDAAETKRLAATQTDDRVKAGLAPAGTPVIVSVNNAPGRRQKGVIIRARKSRYQIKGIGGPYDGKEFTYPFFATELDKSHKSA